MRGRNLLRSIAESAAGRFHRTAITELLADIADGSNLTLDPDLDSFYLIDAAMARQPLLIESLDAVKSQLLIDQPKGHPQEFLATAHRAIGLHDQLNGEALTELDAALTLRINGLRHVLWTQIWASLAGVAVAIYLLVAFYRVAQGGLKEVARHLQEIAKGNLTLNPRPWGKDEAAQLMSTLADTLAALRRVFGQVHAGTHQMELASSEIASVSMDLSRRTEESASELQRATCVMEQMTQTVMKTEETAA